MALELNGVKTLILPTDLLHFDRSDHHLSLERQKGGNQGQLLFSNRQHLLRKMPAHFISSPNPRIEAEKFEKFANFLSHFFGLDGSLIKRSKTALVWEFEPSGKRRPVLFGPDTNVCFSHNPNFIGIQSDGSVIRLNSSFLEDPNDFDDALSIVTIIYDCAHQNTNEEGKSTQKRRITSN